MAVTSRSASPLRWLVLGFGCVALIANYYCYDNPAALKTQLMQRTGMDENAFALSYSLYSLPNIVLPFIGGHFCDVFGAARCLVVFAVLLTAGQTLLAFGVSVSSVQVTLLGRIIFGLGGENMTVALSTLLADWFRGGETAFAMGLFVALARLGSVFNNFASPSIANAFSVSIAVWFGDVMLGVGVVATCAIWWVEGAVGAQIRKAVAVSESAVHVGEGTHHAATSSSTLINDPNRGGHGMNAVLIDESSHASGAMAERQGGDASKEHGQASRSPLSALLSFKASFWLLAVCCVAVYGCVLPFNNVASTLLMERTYFRPSPTSCQLLDVLRCQSASNPPNASACPHATGSASYAPPLPANATVGGVGYSPLRAEQVDCTGDEWAAAGACTYDFCQAQAKAAATATAVMSTPYVISAVSSPFLGLVIDRCGGRALIAALTPVVLIGTHLALAWATSADPMLPLVGQGVAYSVFGAALWPSVPLTVPSAFEGLAYGLVTAVQNAGLTIFPLLVAGVYSASDDRYIPNVELLFVGFAVVGLLAGIALQVYDASRGHVLNRKHNAGLPPLNTAAPAEASVTPLDATAIAG